MSNTIEQRVATLIENNRTIETNTTTWYNRYSTDELPIDTRTTPKYINTNETNIEEDQRLVNAYDSEIVENRINYIMSNPVIFQYTDLENETEMVKNQELINNWVKEDGFQMKLRDLTEKAGATGQCGLLLYNNVDSEGKPMVKTRIVAPWEFILEWTNDQETIVGALRYWSVDELIGSDQIETTTGNVTNTETIYYGEFYDGINIYYLKGNSKENMVVIEEESDIIFGVPLLELKNNTERKPSFYKVISLIDAYNSITSDFTNEIAGLRHAILAIEDAQLATETGDSDDSTVNRLKEYRMLFLESGSKAYYITKEIKYEATEFILKQLEKNIERFANHLNYADPEVYGRATNLAIKTRIKPLENAAKKLAAEITETMQTLFKALGEYWKMQGLSNSFDWRKVETIFTFDAPLNDVEEADKLMKLSTLISKETLLGQASFVDDPKLELERIESELEDESIDDEFNTREMPDED